MIAGFFILAEPIPNPEEVLKISLVRGDSCLPRMCEPLQRPFALCRSGELFNVVHVTFYQAVTTLSVSSGQCTKAADETVGTESINGTLFCHPKWCSKILRDGALFLAFTKGTDEASLTWKILQKVITSRRMWAGEKKRMKCANPARKLNHISRAW